MMKKIIALALALSMALSMVAFAGYTDAAEINKDLQADIELVGALGLMTGNPDGSFNPLGTLTRAEAAVIIYRLHSGKTTIDASWGDKTLSTFTDMDHWSVAYVNYCAALGLVTGYPDGTFRPENPVTAAEMAKMLLNVAGYDTEKQGYGKNWPGAVLADASNAGLFEKYEAAFTGAATREWVAKMVANMLNVKTVVYAYGSYLEKTDKTFGEKYGVASFTGMATANYTEAFATAKKTTDKGTSTVGDATIKYDVPVELLGHDVTVYYENSNKTTDKDGKPAFDAGEKIYAVIDAAQNITETTIGKIIYKENSTSKKMELIVDGVVLDTDVNTSTKVKAIESLTWVGTEKFGKDALKDNRSATVFYNKSNDSWYALYNKVDYVKVDEHKADKNNFAAGGKTYAAEGTKDANKKAYAAINFVDTVVKGDFVAIETVGQYSVSYNVSKINALRTKITSNLNNEKFTVGDTTYVSTDAYETAFESFIATNLTSGEKGGLTKTYDIYTDGKYVVFMEKYEPNTTTVSGLPLDVAYLIAHQDAVNDVFNTSTGKVQVMLNNGSIAIYEYAAPSTGTKVDLDKVDNGSVYELVLNDDGSVYFKQLATEFVDPAVNDGDDKTDASAWVKATEISKLDVNKDVTKTNMKVGEEVVYANADSFLFVQLTKDGKAKYSVVKVSELGAGSKWDNYTFGATTAYTYDKTTGLKYLAYGVVTSATESKLPAATDGATGSDWFLVLKTASAVTTEAGTTYSVEGINAKGEYVTLSLTSKELGSKDAATKADEDDKNDIAANNLYTVKSTSKETWLTNAANWNEDTISASTGSAVVIGGKMIDVAADAVVVYLKETSTNNKYEKVAGPATIPFNGDVYYTLKSDKVNQMIVVVEKDNKIVDNAEIVVPVAPKA